MTDQEAKHLLKDMMDRGLGVSGHNASNGADYYYYQCSMCFARKDTMGFADLEGQLDDVDHHPDCDLVKIASWINEQFPEEEQ